MNDSECKIYPNFFSYLFKFGHNNWSFSIKNNSFKDIEHMYNFEAVYDFVSEL